MKDWKLAEQHLWSALDEISLGARPCGAVEAETMNVNAFFGRRLDLLGREGGHLRVVDDIIHLKAQMNVRSNNAKVRGEKKQLSTHEPSHGICVALLLLASLP